MGINRGQCVLLACYKSYIHFVIITMCKQQRSKTVNEQLRTAPSLCNWNQRKWFVTRGVWLTWPGTWARKFESLRVWDGRQDGQNQSDQLISLRWEQLGKEEKPADRQKIKPADRQKMKPADRQKMKPADRQKMKPADRSQVGPADYQKERPASQAEVKLAA